ncbi:MAG: lactate racemase domain-containing protein [Acidobacteriota bacterium]
MSPSGEAAAAEGMPAASPGEALSSVDLESSLEAESLAIAVPDGTRCMDVPAALGALAERFGGMPGTVVVGLGLHRPMTDDELIDVRAASPWPVVNHDPDACTDLGEVGGHPALVHSALAEAPLVIAVGVVELHQYAGFSGGHKAVAVGCGGRETLASLHARALVCHADVQVGRLSGNPFRDAVDALGERSGCNLALQALPDGRWVAGEPRAALRAAAEALSPWEIVEAPSRSVILRVPGAKAVNFYQASRAATYLALSPRPPLTDGARLVLDAECSEGAGYGDGERAFAQLMASEEPPWDTLLTGEAKKGAGLQRAYMIARLAARYELVVAGCSKPEALHAMGLEATSMSAERVAGTGALEVPAPFTRLPQLA